MTSIASKAPIDLDPVFKDEFAANGSGLRQEHQYGGSDVGSANKPSERPAKPEAVLKPEQFGGL
jgi:hypothetical protein